MHAVSFEILKILTKEFNIGCVNMYQIDCYLRMAHANIFENFVQLNSYDLHDVSLTDIFFQKINESVRNHRMVIDVIALKVSQEV